MCPMTKTTVSRSKKKHPLLLLMAKRGVSSRGMASIVGVHYNLLYRITKGENYMTQATLDLISQGMQLSQEETDRLATKVEQWWCESTVSHAHTPKGCVELDRSLPPFTPMTPEAKQLWEEVMQGR